MFWGDRGYSAGYTDGYAAGAKANQKPWTEIRDDGYGNPYTVHMPGGYYCRNVTEEEEEDMCRHDTKAKEAVSNLRRTDYVEQFVGVILVVVIFIIGTSTHLLFI